jgi:hypothetical protein
MGFVYFARDTVCDLVKIGFATNPIARFMCARSFNPHEVLLIGVMRGSRVDEQRLHDRFESLRVTREWHRPAASLMRFIRANSMQCAALLDLFPTPRSDARARLRDAFREMPGFARLRDTDGARPFRYARRKSRAGS